jgi:succinate-acetate transporter protein
MLGSLGYTASVGSFLTYGIIWLVLAVLMWLTTVRIRKKQIASEKWLLLALSIITMFAGRIESGVLALIASILYLRQK